MRVHLRRWRDINVGICGEDETRADRGSNYIHFYAHTEFYCQLQVNGCAGTHHLCPECEDHEDLPLVILRDVP
jgi:hypothetical protein